MGKLSTVKLLLCTVLFLMGVELSAQNPTIVINADNSGISSSYSDNTFVVEGVNFGYTQWMQSNDKNKNIQAKKSITNSCYNVSAIPGKIVKITVEQTGTARAITFKGGNDASSVTNAIKQPSTGAKMEFDFTEGDYTFFAMNTPSNACYINSITIEYLESEKPTKDYVSLSLSGQPIQTEYEAGEVLNPYGMTLKGIDKDGNEETIYSPMEELSYDIKWSFTPATLSVGNTSCSVTATVGEVSTDPYTVNGLTVVAAKVLTGITVTGTPAEFWLGDAFNTTGITVTATYDDNSTADVTNEAAFLTQDMNVAGKKTITVTYKDKSTTYEIEVKTIANTQETAYTTEQAIALINAGKDLATEVYVKGVISSVESFNDRYGSITYWLDEGSFEIYGGLNKGGAKFTGKDDLAEGAKVIVLGKIKKYNTTYEMDLNSKLVYYNNEPEEEEGTPMEPIAPDLSQYTHKVMLVEYYINNKISYKVYLRDELGRMIQTMAMKVEKDGKEAMQTDTIETYVYEDNKVTIYRNLPSYDAEDKVKMTALGKYETSYYKLSNGHREVMDDYGHNGSDYVLYNRAISVYDNEGRLISYKFGRLVDNEIPNPTYQFTYTYADNGVYKQGKDDGETVNYFEQYDKNGNLITYWNLKNKDLYKYTFDSRNHNLGYIYYKGYNADTKLAKDTVLYNSFEVVETFSDGSVKRAVAENGAEKSYTRDGYTETELITYGYDTYRYRRTFTANGDLKKKERLSSSSETVMEAYTYSYSTWKASQVLGCTNVIDDGSDPVAHNHTYWTSYNPISSQQYENAEYGENDFIYYKNTPISVMPAESSSEGVTIPLGEEGDQLAMDMDGEIYLIDKGGKKRYSVSLGDQTISTEGGKITISGWSAVEDAQSAPSKKAPRKIQKVKVDGEVYDIYIPANTLKINNEPMNELFTTIKGNGSNIETGVEDTLQQKASSSHKVIVNATLLIERDGKYYTIMGQPVQ